MGAFLSLTVFLLAIAAWGSFGATGAPTPPLTVATPGDNTVTNNSTIAVSGTTDPGASLVINGFVVAVGADGNFSVVIALLPGANVVNVTASNGPGAAATVLLNVSYGGGSSGSEAQLRALQDRLAVTESDLAGAQDELTSVRIDLTRTRNDLTNSTQDVAALSGQVLALSILATVAMLAAVGAIGLTMFQASRAKDESPKEGKSS